MLSRGGVGPRGQRLPGAQGVEQRWRPQVLPPAGHLHARPHVPEEILEGSGALPYTVLRPEFTPAPGLRHFPATPGERERVRGSPAAAGQARWTRAELATGGASSGRGRAVRGDRLSRRREGSSPGRGGPGEGTNIPFPAGLCPRNGWRTQTFTPRPSRGREAPGTGGSLSGGDIWVPARFWL